MKKYKRFCTRTDRKIIFNILILYWNFEWIFEFMALKRAPICGRNVCISFFSFCAFLNLIIIILIKENKKKLTLCQRNEQSFKYCSLITDHKARLRALLFLNYITMIYQTKHHTAPAWRGYRTTNLRKPFPAYCLKMNPYLTK